MEAKKTAEDTFTKDAILKSRKYADRKDALDVVLEDDQKYTLSDVDKKLEKFMKGKV